MKTIIHVNQHVIKANAKSGDNNPCLTIKDYTQNRYGHEAEVWYNDVLVGKFVYRPDTPLSCGAKVWFETQVCQVKEVVYDGCNVQDQEGTQGERGQVPAVC